MLKITIDVKSGIKEFVVPAKAKGSYIDKFGLSYQAKNRHKFLQGVLLYLMGERVSLYAIERHKASKSKPEDDPIWHQQQTTLNDFLSKLDLKGCIKPYKKNIDVMAFSQHRKHGVVMHANYKLNGNNIETIGEDGSRLNADYGEFVKAGLFDVFDLPNADLSRLLTSKAWETSKPRVNAALLSVLEDADAFDEKNILTLSAAKHLQTKLADIFVALPKVPDEIKHEDTYRAVVNNFITHDALLSEANAKSSPFKTEIADRTPAQIEKVDELTAGLEVNQARFSYFMWRYLLMYIDLFETKGGKPNCTKFGISSLDFKTQKGLASLVDWLNDPLKAFNEKPSQNASTEFYKGIFIAPKYGVSTRAPVNHVRYDGVFELYINTDSETESFIQSRIMQSGRWYLRVGKLSLGRLRKTPERIPPSYWQSIKDDG